MKANDDQNGRTPNSEAKHLIERARQQAESINASTVNCLHIAPDSFPGLEIIREINGGGQGIVYEAKHLATQQRVAVKQMNRHLQFHPDQVKRFELEVYSLRELHHPHIARLRDANLTASPPYIVMELVAGVSLDRHVDLNKPTQNSILELFIKVCDAVAFAHARGIIHRDLKPANILVDAQGDPHVLDFGLAKLCHDAAQGPIIDLLTKPGQFVGSLPWSAPEQLGETESQITTRTDVYLMGLLLYHALTGRLPYELGAGPLQTMRNIQEADPIPPRSLRPEIDNDLETILLHCLHKNPERRYAGAAALAQDLKNRLRKRPISIKGDSTFYLARMAMRRHRGWTVTAAVAVVATITYASTMTAMYSRTRQAEQRSVMELAEMQDTVSALLEASWTMSRIAGTKHISVDLAQKAAEQLNRIAALGTNDNLRLREDQAVANSLLGVFAREDGDYDGARTHLDEAVRLRDGLIREFPDNHDYQADYSIALVQRGDLAGALGDRDFQLALYRRALHIDERLANLQPENTTYLDNLAWSYQRLLESDDALDADIQVAYPEKIRAIAEHLVAAEPNNAVRRWLLYYVKRQDLREALETGAVEKVERETLAVAELAESLMRLEPHNPLFARGLSHMLLKSAWYVYQRGDYGRAQGFLDAAEQALSHLPAEERATRRGLLAQVEQLSLRATLSRRFGDDARHRNAVAGAIGLLQDAERLAPGDAEVLSKLTHFHVMQARVHLDEGDQIRGEAVARRALDLACQVFEHPSAKAGDLVSIAGSFAWLDPPQLRDPGQAIVAMERASERPGFKRDGKYLERLTRFLVEDGRIAQARALLPETWDSLSPTDFTARQILLEMLPPVAEHSCAADGVGDEWELRVDAGTP